MHERGTMKECLAIEVLSESVIVRTNIARVEEQGTDGEIGFVGWEYDETIYTKDEYIKEISNVNSNLTQLIADLTEIVLGV